MPRLIVLDPSQAVAVIAEELAERFRYTLLHNVSVSDQQPGDVVLLTASAVAGQSPVAASLDVLVDARKVLLGDPEHAAKIASASSQVGAHTVVLSPYWVESFAEILAPAPANCGTDVARARALMSVSVMDVTDEATREGLARVAHAFLSEDAIVWWREQETMRPRTARQPPESGYRTSIATAARIAAAADCTVVLVVGSEVRSVAAIALSVGNNEVNGLFAVVADRARQFSLQEREDLRAFAPRVAREFSWRAGYLRLVAEGDGLRTSILHDPLTGMLTRVALEQASTQEVAAAQRRGESLSLLVFDIVGMRRLNLRLGHSVGDELLARLAARLRTNVRSNDQVGRYGGDELAVLLAGANMTQAKVVAEKLLAALVSPPFEIDGNVIDLQLRAVVAPIAAGERSGEAAFARAAAHLKQATPGVVVAEIGDERQSGDVGQAALSIGATLGGTYRVRHELSRGAMGVVYRGEDIGLGRAVAIKVLRSDLASDLELVERFRAEAAMLASLRHNNLVQVYALGEHGGDVYFVMELVEGQPLSDVLRSLVDRGEWFPPAAIAQIALEIGDAPRRDARRRAHPSRRQARQYSARSR
ncbi:MAG: diguanylate cyclase [Myxococcales bacterium]|nr:diguanylate cyclase [Myxococcales bacterium]